VPELPDIEMYREALEQRIAGQTLETARVSSPSLLRTVAPKLDDALGRKVVGLHRIGKRIAIELEHDLHLVIHLMIAGRLQWKKSPPKPGRRIHAIFEFGSGVMVVTEAGTKKRASLHVLRGPDLGELDPGGLEVLDASLDHFASALTRENHTLKRSLTDPHLFSGIGNAYSDEILHRACMSPIKLSQRMQAAEIEVLYKSTRLVLSEWLDRLRDELSGNFPQKVTAFHPEMAVHGRYREPCLVCEAPIQRIVRGNHETNYCPRCQTGGKVLADRALSKLLKKDWPRSLEELDEKGLGRRREPG
jgi:formamidopyrimidine-DNA glycosylase